MERVDAASIARYREERERSQRAYAQSYRPPRRITVENARRPLIRCDGDEMSGEVFDVLELMTSAFKTQIWTLTTSRSLKAVLEPGYWLRFTDHGIKRYDRILVTASAREFVPELGELLCLESNLAGYNKRFSFVVLSQRKLEAKDVISNNVKAA